MEKSKNINLFSGEVVVATTCRPSGETRGEFSPLEPGKLETLLLRRSSEYIDLFATPALLKITEFPSGNQFTLDWFSWLGRIGCGVPPLLEIR